MAFAKNNKRRLLLVLYWIVLLDSFARKASCSIVNSGASCQRVSGGMSDWESRITEALLQQQKGGFFEVCLDPWILNTYGGVRARHKCGGNDDDTFVAPSSNIRFFTDLLGKGLRNNLAKKTTKTSVETERTLSENMPPNDDDNDGALLTLCTKKPLQIEYIATCRRNCSSAVNLLSRDYNLHLLIPLNKEDPNHPKTLNVSVGNNLVEAMESGGSYYGRSFQYLRPTPSSDDARQLHLQHHQHHMGSIDDDKMKMDDDSMNGPDFCMEMSGMTMVMYMRGFRWTHGGDHMKPCLSYLSPTWVLRDKTKFQGAVIYTFLLALLTQALSAVRALVIQHVHHEQARKWIRVTIYVLQAMMGYLIMLVTMMYSLELLLSVVAGIAMGYRLFGEYDEGAARERRRRREQDFSNAAAPFAGILEQQHGQPQQHQPLEQQLARMRQERAQQELRHRRNPASGENRTASAGRLQQQQAEEGELTEPLLSQPRSNSPK